MCAAFTVAPFEKAEILRGALEKLPEILQDYRKIYVVADQNTFAVCGKRVCEILQNVGMLSHFYVLDGENILPNAETLGKILLHAHDPNAKSVFCLFAAAGSYPCGRFGNGQ